MDFQLQSIVGVANLDWRMLVMYAIGLALFYLAIKKDFEPLLLIPIGFGILLGNIPPILIHGQPVFMADIHNPENPMYYIYLGAKSGLYPVLISLGIGAMTDFGPLIANPRLVLLGAAAQAGIFITVFLAMAFGFSLKQAGAIGIIGGADGPTAIFLSAKLAPELLAPIAIAAYSYIALVPLIQPPIMRLLTSRQERLIRMKSPRTVSRTERLLFPVAAFLLSNLISPGSALLVGMICFGNLLKESGKTDGLAKTAAGPFTDGLTILIGLSVGVAASAQTFLTARSLLVFAMGMFAFVAGSACGILFAKIMNLLSREKINPIIGAAGISALPMCARVAHTVANKEDPQNFLLFQALAPNVAGQIGSAIAAGVMWAMLG